MTVVRQIKNRTMACYCEFEVGQVTNENKFEMRKKGVSKQSVILTGLAQP